MRLFSLFIILFSLNSYALIQPKEKFEWGAGILSMRGNHYRGSDQLKNYFFPLPYFVYKSEKIEAEPSFIRGNFFKNEWFSLSLSLIAGLSVESEKNEARRGMPEIDYTFQAGTLMSFKLWKSADKLKSLTLEWAFRQSHATDLSFVDPIGFFSIAYFNFVHAPNPMLSGWSYEFSIGPMWASRKYHHYYYGVSPEHANANRAAYDGKAGYGGIQAAIVMNKRWKDFVFVPFIRFDNLSGAAFEDSPLLIKKSYLIGGLGLFWLFGS